MTNFETTDAYQRSASHLATQPGTATNSNLKCNSDDDALENSIGHDEHMFIARSNAQAKHKSQQLVCIDTIVLCGHHSGALDRPI